MVTIETRAPAYFLLTSCRLPTDFLPTSQILLALPNKVSTLLRAPTPHHFRIAPPPRRRRCHHRPPPPSPSCCRQTTTSTATIATTIAAMMEGGGDRAYDKNECEDGIVGTNERGVATARGDDTNCLFLGLCLHPRLVLVLTLPAGPFKTWNN